MSNHIFKVCSHIQKYTQNPNTIFKIPIYCTKYTNNVKILSNILKHFGNRTISKIIIYVLLCFIIFFNYYLYKFRNSYFVFSKVSFFFFRICVRWRRYSWVFAKKMFQGIRKQDLQGCSTKRSLSQRICSWVFDLDPKSRDAS